MKHRSEVKVKRIIYALIPYQKTRGRETCCPASPQLASVNKMIRIFTSENWYRRRSIKAQSITIQDHHKLWHNIIMRLSS